MFLFSALPLHFLGLLLHGLQACGQSALLLGVILVGLIVGFEYGQ